MPKRTSNSSVNSSIRQQTKANDEGLGALLDAQKASLGELTSIKQLLTLSKEHQKNLQTEGGLSLLEQKMMFDELTDIFDANKRHYKTEEEMWEKWEQSWDAESKKIADIAKLMDTTGNKFQEISKSFKEKVQGVKENVGIKNGGLKGSVMSALNVGGVFNKAIAKNDWKKRQAAMTGVDAKDISDEDAEGAYHAAKKIKAHDAEISKWQKTTGITDENEMRKTKVGAELLKKKQFLGDEYATHDQSASKIASPTPVLDVNPEAAKKTPTQTAAESTQNEEMQMEGAKAEEAQTDLLKKIEENTRAGKDQAKPEKVKEGKGIGEQLMDMITEFMGSGFMTAIKNLFSPKNLLKSLGKVFAIGAIVGALWEGISDGFDEFMKTGDIGKALIAGLAGIVDFLTFGLFDKDKIKEVIGDMASWVDDHIVKPVSEFFGSMKDSFLALISNIGIPEIDISGFTKFIPGAPDKIGPFYPFKSDGGSKTPEAPAPTSANAVDQKSADNAAAAIPEASGGNKTNVVNAPVVNNTTQNQVIRAPIRNQDSSVGSYQRSRYA